MKTIKNIGLVIFLIGLATFASLTVIGTFKVTPEIVVHLAHIPSLETFIFKTLALNPKSKNVINTSLMPV